MGSVRHLVAVVKGIVSILFTCYIRDAEIWFSRFFIAPQPERYTEVLSPDEETGGWFLFNDFMVQRVPEDEALSFPGKWKVRELVIIIMWFMSD